MVPLLVIVVLGILFFFTQTKEEEPIPLEARPYHTEAVEITQVGDLVVQQEYIPYNSPRRPGEIREIRRIIIHETDNRSRSADAKAHSQFLSSDTTDITGWHYTVDDHSIYHHLPDNEIAWNAGDQRSRDGGNINGIGIEMCVNLGNDFDLTIQNTAQLCADLLVTYDLTPEDIYLHQDFMDKVCPHRLITENKVPYFRQLVEDNYEVAKKEETK